MFRRFKILYSTYANRRLIQSHVAHFPTLQIEVVAWLSDKKKTQKQNIREGSLPTSRQCFSIRRESATFSPISVQAGDVSWILAKSALTLNTRPPVDVEPILIRRSSPLTNFPTLVCFLSSVLTPSNRRSRNRLISSSARKE